MAVIEQQLYTGRDAVGSGSGRFFLGLFIISLILPMMISLSGYQLWATRVLLMLAVVPCAAKIYAGQCGPVRATDILLPLHGLWIVVTLVYHHGMSKFGFSMITAVEIIGAYYVGRVFVRDFESYRFMLKMILWTLVLLFPLAVFEIATGRMILSDLLGGIVYMPERSGTANMRLGLQRVQTVFPHPILFGLYGSLMIANVIALFYGRKGMQVLGLGFVILMTMFSLSAAPLLAIVVQIGLILWGIIMKDAWKLFIGLFLFCYVTVDLLSNRTPITIAIDYVTFSSSTAWNRVLIFRYGSPVVMDNPLLGIGLKDWPRPHWMLASVDNYWLLNGMRYGLVGLLFLGGAFVWQLLQVATKPIFSDELKAYRKAYVICMVGLIFTLSTVHIWDTLLSLIFLYLGAGRWFVDLPDETAAENDDPETAAEEPQVRTRYTRFPSVHRRQGPAGTHRPAI